MQDFDVQIDEFTVGIDRAKLKSIHQGLQYAYEEQERTEFYSQLAQMIGPQIFSLSQIMGSLDKESATEMLTVVGRKISFDIEIKMFPLEALVGEDFQANILNELSKENDINLVQYNSVRAKLDQGILEELVDVRMKQHARALAIGPRALSDLRAICRGLPDSDADPREFFREEFKKFQTMSYQDLKEDRKRMNEILPVESIGCLINETVGYTYGAQVTKAIRLFARETPVEKVVDVGFKIMDVGGQMCDLLAAGKPLSEGLKKQGMECLAEAGSILQSGWNAMAKANIGIAARFDEVLDEARVNAKRYYQSPYVSGAFRPGFAGSDKQSGTSSANKRDCLM